MGDSDKTIGWHHPPSARSRKKHYYDGEGSSLCRQWALVGFGKPEDADQRVGDEPRKDECLACWRKAKKDGS